MAQKLTVVSADTYLPYSTHILQLFVTLLSLHLFDIGYPL